MQGMTMVKQDERLDVQVVHRGESGFEVTSPIIAGWECVWVARVGGSHTTFTYRKAK